MKWYEETKQLYAVATIFLCAFIFLTVTTIVLSGPLPLGSDTYFHLAIARELGNGNFTGAVQIMFSVNHYPYPILYHLLIAPIAVNSDPYDLLRVLEMLFLPVTYALIALVVWKFAGAKAALISSLVLISGWAFLDGAIQARPESLDLLLYPLIILCLLSVKKKWVSTLSLLTVYNHGLAALSNIFGFAVRKLQEKSWRKTIVITLVIATPIIALSIWFFSGAWQQWATYTPTENPQEALFWTYPPWIPYYAGLSLIGWIFVALSFSHNGWKPILKTKSELETLLVYGLIGNFIMLPFWADRWLQYSSIPLSMLTGIVVSRWHGRKLYVTLFGMMLIAAIYLMTFYLIAFTHNYWQPGKSLLQGARAFGITGSP